MGLLLFLVNKNNSLLCLHDLLIPREIQVLLLFLQITLTGGEEAGVKYL
jgi:hypothetical protein